MMEYLVIIISSSFKIIDICFDIIPLAEMSLLNAIPSFVSNLRAILQFWIFSLSLDGELIILSEELFVIIWARFRRAVPSERSSVKLEMVMFRVCKYELIHRIYVLIRIERVVNSVLITEICALKIRSSSGFIRSFESISIGILLFSSVRIASCELLL